MPNWHYYGYQHFKHPQYVHQYPAGKYVNQQAPYNYANVPAQLPSDYADLLEVALATNVANIGNANLIRYILSMDELGHHRQLLRYGAIAAPEMCLRRCWHLYQRCLRFADTAEQQHHCFDLYQQCRAACMGE